MEGIKKNCETVRFDGSHSCNLKSSPYRTERLRAHNLHRVMVRTIQHY